jgi:hypothetical protein
MAQLISYPRDETISENDFVIGTDSVTKQSKNFVLGNLRVFMNAESTSNPTFEYYSKNLKQYPYLFNYTGDMLTSIIYDTPDGIITKTFVYLSNILDKIILSGDIPSEIDTIKQFNYTLDKLTSITYS